MKTLRFNERENSEPVSLPIKTFEKYMKDGCEKVLCDGVVTHITRNPDITNFDPDKIRSAVGTLFAEAIDPNYGSPRVVDEFEESRIAASSEIIVTVKREGDSLVFNSVVVRPEFE